MRLFTSICAVLLFSGLAIAQAPVRPYGYGPYIPMVTTPQISFQTASPTPAGAHNATSGLTAGARNSTFETMGDNAPASYTEPVWYTGGGSPRMSNEISLYPRSERGQREMHMMMQRREEHAEAPRQWTYFGASDMETPIDTTAGKTARHATRTITNDDIDRANQKTGTVKYDGKTEKMQ